MSILIVDDEPDVAEPVRQRFRREARQDAYVLHVAGSGGDERRRRASEYGAAEFITRPVDFGMLKSQLRLPSGDAG